MSDLVVRVEKIREITPHSNADRLELATIQGWQVVILKDSMSVGDFVFYVPPDCMLPERAAKTFGVEKYLGKHGRVKKIRLRGEVSLGLCVPVGVADTPFMLGEDAAEYWGITKYVPPKRNAGGAFRAGRTRSEIKGFAKYTEIQNLRHYRSKIADGTPVFVQEKLHGTNSRIGLVRGLMLSGSRNLRRGNPYATKVDRVKEAWLVYTSNRSLKTLVRELGILWHALRGRRAEADAGIYSMPWGIPGVKGMLQFLSNANDGASTVVYGEIYGGGVQGQAMNYGTGEAKHYAVFDISIAGRYVSPEYLIRVCEIFGVPTAPVVVKTTAYDFDRIKDLSSGKSLVHGADHVREGVVVRTLNPGTSEERVILKLVSDEYLVGDYEDFLEE